MKAKTIVITGSTRGIGLELAKEFLRTDFLNVSMNHATEDEKKRFEKVYRILAEDADVVARYLAPRIMKSTKNCDKIEFLSGIRLFPRIVKLMFAR